MATRPWYERTFWTWVHCPSFTTKDGRIVYPIRTDGVGRDGYPTAAKVRVFDAPIVDLTDPSIENGAFSRAHLIGHLEWTQHHIEYIETVTEWQRQGIAAGMLRNARRADPELRHAPPHLRTPNGEAFVRATDPHEASAPQPIPTPKSVRPRWWDTLLRRRTTTRSHDHAQ